MLTRSSLFFASDHFCIIKCTEVRNIEVTSKQGCQFFVLKICHSRGVFTWENSHRCEFHTGMNFWFLFCVYMMTGSFHILLFEGTFRVDNIHLRFKIANITQALPVPVYRQTDFTPKRVVVSRLHDTVARFRTRVKFSPRYENRGELTPGWLAPA